MLSDPHPDLIRPIATDRFLPPVSLWTSIGGLFLAGSVGAAFTLAAVIRYNVTVKAPATIRPSGETRIVQAASEGIVKVIKVKENQRVRKGDIIARIEDSQLQTKKSQLTGNIQKNRLQLSQINAKLNALQTQMTAESSSMQRAIAAAQADLSLSQRDYSDRQITTQTEMQEALASLELAQEQLKRYQLLGNTGAISKLQIKEKEQAFKVAQARLRRAKKRLNPNAATVAIAQEHIAQERAKGKSTLATLNREREELIRRQVEIQNQITSERKELKQLETELQKTIIRTPQAGTILKLELRNLGQVVRPGQAIAQIAPSNDNLVVKARVAAQDISKVKVCKAKKVSDCQEGKVRLRVSAYPYPDYGVLVGAVQSISADVRKSISSIPNSSKVTPYYEVTIKPEKPYLVKNQRQYPIQSGMEVTADIISREETVLSFILRKARLMTDL